MNILSIANILEGIFNIFFGVFIATIEYKRKGNWFWFAIFATAGGITQILIGIYAR